MKANCSINNIIIQTVNVLFQIAKLEDQLNPDNPIISNIDLGKCEKILRDNLQLHICPYTYYSLFLHFHNFFHFSIYRWFFC